MSDIIKAYKWTADLRPIYGTGEYAPVGEWQPQDQTPVPCESGYHACTAAQVPQWCGTELWTVELRGPVVDAGDKLCATNLRLVRKLKWTREDMVAYAQACAERAASYAARYAASAASAASAAASAADAADAASYAARYAASAASYAARYAAERQWQKEWIEARIGEKLT